jgi:DNA-binding transcriptional regulator LsrR (DeoR family)
MINKQYEYDDLLVRASWYYYKSKLTQKEVGDKLNLSRQRVQRLLDEARQKGIIQVEIESPLANLLSIEEALIKEHSLKDAVVVPSVPSENGLRDSLGQAAATYVERLITDSEIKVIGTGWGRTLRAFVDKFRTKHQCKEMNVVSLVGNLLKDTAVNPYIIADTLSRKLSANCYNIWAPSIVKDENRAKIFRSEPWIKKALEKAKSADVIIVSLGPVSKQVTLYDLGYLSKEDLLSLQSLGAAGDILGQFFNEQGELVDSNLHKRVIALPFKEVQDRKRKVIVIAGGKDKLRAIKGALNGNFIDILVTDENVAKQLAHITTDEKEVVYESNTFRS